MRGSYKYAPMKFIFAKIFQTNGRSGKGAQEELCFIDGDYICYQHANIELTRLTAGEYIIFFKIEWDVLNLVRRSVVNIYSVDPIEIKRIHTKQFPLSVFSMMDEWLS